MRLTFQQLIILSFLAITFFSCSRNEEMKSLSLFNDNWKFLKPDSILLSEKAVLNLNDDAWESITLPHTASVEPSVMKEQQWTGICWYKKTFSISAANKEKHIGIQFEGMMSDAVIWLNGNEIGKHQGGYLPFYLDISGLVSSDTSNTILIRLDNRDNPAFPPGKPLAGLDFNYYSGIYRNAFLVIKDKLHFTVPMEIDTVQGGGIIVSTESISEGTAILKISAGIFNQSDKTEEFTIKAVLKNRENQVVESISSETITLSPEGILRVPLKMQLPEAKLWSPESPYLYSLETLLTSGSEILESTTTKIGIREITINAKDGFIINGNKVKIRGTNRHQEYPYIGNALSDNAHYRDAWKIKNAGFNFVRTSHYPQAPAFLDACDELGLLVMDAIPGWQFIGDSVFMENSHRDTREMCRRDRNHPSIILWENSLNETNMPIDFIKKSNDFLRSELPFNGIYTCGWMDTIYSVFIPARQHAQPPAYWSDYSKDRPLLIAEYGDWEYYAQNAGFNQTEFKNLSPVERSSRQLRSSGEIGLLQQAFNYQESHNDNLNGPAIGDANWLMFDYNRGYAPDIESSGIRDIFRIPKFAFWFYKSQSDDEPVCFIASYNTSSSARYIRVFSNGDSVSLYRNGLLLGTQIPDRNINTTNLKHPPFTFLINSFEAGTLRAESFRYNKVDTSHQISTAGAASKLSLIADFSGKKLKTDGGDVIFIYASVTDSLDNTNYDSANDIKFTIEGDASLIGTNPVPAEAGIASILIKAGSTAGIIRVSAVSEGLTPAIIEIISEK